MSDFPILNILLATDFQPWSEPALAYSALIAKRFAARLTVAHVVVPFVFPIEGAEALQVTDTAATETMKRLDRRLAGISHRCVVLHGLLWERLRDTAEKSSADLIVVGTRAPSGRFLLGSVAEAVLRLAYLPVVVVPQDAKVTGTAGFSSVLAAIDFTGSSEIVAESAARFAAADHGQLTLVYCIEEKPTHIRDAPRVIRSIEDQLSRLLPLTMQRQVILHLRVEFGRAEQRIAELADELHADLVVAGAHTSDFPDQTTHFPSKIHNIARRIKCPMLVLGPEAWEQEQLAAHTISATK